MSDAVDRLNAALEGRYRIESELGEGGMATVYLADDLKHERKVALKVLKPELAAVVGAERFLAEIKTTANLQHPHILPLFDSGEADSFLFYVMPWVEGESLREKLDREHQLPVDDAVRIATNVAEALDYAHRQGVIHRDIKPGNVLIHDGQPVISDFGIALAVGTAGQGRLTETGLSMGTPHYMSPEQATGDLSVGAASDVYALGCVLYEMLVAEPPYTGGTPQAILGKIIAGELASASKHRSSVPTNVDAAISKALEKVPADRFIGAQDFARALADPGFRHGVEVAAGSAVGRRQWTPLAMVSTGLALIFGMVAGWSLLRPEPPEAVSRFAMDVQPAIDHGVAISPDGLVLVVGEPHGRTGSPIRLWQRRLDRLGPTPIPDTEGLEVHSPAISPDGSEVAFHVDGQIKVAPLRGGIVRTVAEGGACCARWGPDGFIYYSPVGRAINRVPSQGGVAEAVTDLAEGDAGHRFRQVLPGGEFAILVVDRVDGEQRIEALNLRTGERRVLTVGFSPHVAPTGHLLFSSVDGRLLGAPFDLTRAELTGPATPLIDGLAVYNGVFVSYDVSQSGTLVYVTGDSGRGLAPMEFVWVTRSGQATPVDPGYTLPQATGNFGLRLSPDETRIAFNSTVDGNTDVRIKHLPDGPEERITFSEESDIRPVWTPDGQSVTYFSGTSEDRSVWSKRADGTGERVLVLHDERPYAQGSWSPNGEWLLLRAGATGVWVWAYATFWPSGPAWTAPPCPSWRRPSSERRRPACRRTVGRRDARHASQYTLEWQS